ncbi:hypothetical protein [Thermococcus sp. Bubb.Bath]|uniref:hypothetical protein n=1 Tax=Thermococcus sp. Bubb.Bath TaxID=1638242 RepID=UPI00143A11AA|nr:hypothetical protein [Thermococcus sp. Bubb.Bath]NJF25585.1 hypothetical protein [Thermococcus sp. Bubb.Bath]
MVEELKKRWLLLFAVSFSIFGPSVMVIGDYLLSHREAIIVVPLWFVWIYYLVPAGSIVYDVWSLLIAGRKPWVKVALNYRGGTFLIFIVILGAAWIFTHNWAIALPLIVSTILYGFSIAKSAYLEVIYPISIGISVLIEFQSQPELLFAGEGLLLIYFLALRHIREMMEQKENRL